MTPARTWDVPRTHVPPTVGTRRTAVRSASDPVRVVQARREQLQPASPLTPVPALGTLPQMRVERRSGDLRRQLLAVDAGGQGGTELHAVHPAIVPGAAGAPRTTPRAGGRSA